MTRPEGRNNLIRFLSAANQNVDQHYDVGQLSLYLINFVVGIFGTWCRVAIVKTNANFQKLCYTLFYVMHMLC